MKKVKWQGRWLWKPNLCQCGASTCISCGIYAKSMTQGVKAQQIQEDGGTHYSNDPSCSCPTCVADDRHANTKVADLMSADPNPQKFLTKYDRDTFKRMAGASFPSRFSVASTLYDMIRLGLIPAALLLLRLSCLSLSFIVYNAVALTAAVLSSVVALFSS